MSKNNNGNNKGGNRKGGNRKGGGGQVPVSSRIDEPVGYDLKEPGVALLDSQ